MTLQVPALNLRAISKGATRGWQATGEGLPTDKRGCSQVCALAKELRSGGRTTRESASE